MSPKKRSTKSHSNRHELNVSNSRFSPVTNYREAVPAQSPGLLQLWEDSERISTATRLRRFRGQWVRNQMNRVRRNPLRVEHGNAATQIQATLGLWP